MEFYPYPPEKRVSPFEPSDADNYFVGCKLLSYLGNYEEIGNLWHHGDKRNENFWGNWVICIYKRRAVIKKGKVAYINKQFHDGHTIGFSRLENNPEPIQYAIITNKLLKYVVPSWNGRTLQSYSVHDEHNPLQLKLFASFNEAVEYAMSLSQENDVDCIVAQWFADIDMH